MEQSDIINLDFKITLGNTYGDIVDISGKRKFFLEYNKSGLMDFEKKMILDNKCSCILPMSILNIDDKERIYFDFTDFIQLSQYIKKHLNKGQEALEIVLKILNTFKNCEDFLVSLDRIPMILDTFFINTKTRNISIAYIPSLRNSSPFRTKILTLLKSIDEQYDDMETSHYFIKLIETIYDKNLGLDGIICTLDCIIREVNYNQWTKRSLRKDLVEEKTL